jgi:TatD DNase family protein
MDATGGSVTASPAPGRRCRRPGGFDALTHLDFPEFDADREQVTDRARQAGVTAWVIAGFDPNAWDRVEVVAAATGGIAALGVHPWRAALMEATALDAALSDLERRAPAGIGEIGFDRLHARGPTHHDRQWRALRGQLAVARSIGRPVLLHIVRAYPEVLSMIARDGLPAAGGMIHGWSGPVDQLRRAVELGLYISFGPAILRERSAKIREAAVQVPARRLLAETDAPDAAPPGATRGEPADWPRVVDALAVVRNQPADELWATIAANSRELWAHALDRSAGARQNDTAIGPIQPDKNARNSSAS